MGGATFPFPAVRLLRLIFIVCSICPFTVAADTHSLVVAQSTSLQLSPSSIVERSPGSKPGAKVVCDRVEIHGLSRLKNLKKFSHLVKVKVSYVNSSTPPPNMAVCFHRNASLGIGMCPEDQWHKLTKGSWIRSMSPFDHKLLDIRIVGSSMGTFEVSLHEEFFLHRLIFLVMGIALMILAPSLSNSLVFYYGGAMAVGVILVILIILFQGMRLLPTGRKSSLAVIMYAAIVGVGSFLLSYVPRLLRSILVEIGIGEDLYTPMAIFLVAFVVLAGAWLGFWVVRKLVLTEAGSIDIAVAHFVAWSIRIFASIMILQSSVDPLLAFEALVCGGMLSSVLRRFAGPRFIGHLYQILLQRNEHKHRRSHKGEPSPTEDSYGEYSIKRPQSRSFTMTPCTTRTQSSQLSESEPFYSTFHNTPDRRKISKDEWDKFTKESTKRAVEGLVSSPDFSKWAVAHADRITLLPKKDKHERRRSWFPWS